MALFDCVHLFQKTIWSKLFEYLFVRGSHLLTNLRNELNIISGAESRNSERAFNYAQGFADTRFFQGLYGFYLGMDIGSLTFHNKISDLVK